jgi:hypothetical protein
MPNINYLSKKGFKDDRHYLSNQKLFILDTFCEKAGISYDDIEEHDVNWLKNKIRQYKLKTLENE